MITEIRIGCSKTVNLGNFNSIKVEAHLTMSIPDSADTDHYTQMKREAQVELSRLIDETFKAQKRER